VRHLTFTCRTLELKLSTVEDPHHREPLHSAVLHEVDKGHPTNNFQPIFQVTRLYSSGQEHHSPLQYEAGTCRSLSKLIVLPHPNHSIRNAGKSIAEVFLELACVCRNYLPKTTLQLCIASGPKHPLNIVEYEVVPSCHLATETTPETAALEQNPMRGPWHHAWKNVWKIG
jgi:hypothetical protein